MSNNFSSFLDFLSKCGPELVRLTALAVNNRNKSNYNSLISVMASPISKNIVLNLISSNLQYDMMLKYPFNNDDNHYDGSSNRLSFDKLLNPGVYSIFVETESESHKFIIVTHKNEENIPMSTYIGTYGGYSKFSIYQCDTSKMITYLSRAFLPVVNISVKEKRIAMMLLYCNLDINVNLPHLYDDNFVSSRITRLKIKKLKITPNDFDVNCVLTFRKECLQTVFRLILDENGDVYNPNIDALKIHKYQY